jgi:Bacterial regulatory proteins, gntR family
MRISQDATLIEPEHHVEWFQQASARPLPKFELSVLRAIADHHACRLRGGAGRISIERIAFAVGGVSPARVRAALTRLVDLGLVAIQRGSGTRGSSFHMCLPRHSVLASALAGETVPGPATSQC